MDAFDDRVSTGQAGHAAQHVGTKAAERNKSCQLAAWAGASVVSRRPQSSLRSRLRKAGPQASCSAQAAIFPPPAWLACHLWKIQVRVRTVEEILFKYSLVKKERWYNDQKIITFVTLCVSKEKSNCGQSFARTPSSGSVHRRRVAFRAPPGGRVVARGPRRGR